MQGLMGRVDGGAEGQTCPETKRRRGFNLQVLLDQNAADERSTNQIQGADRRFAGKPDWLLVPAQLPMGKTVFSC